MRASADLPVAVELPGPLGQEVANWVEDAGWQLVDPDGPPPPVLSLVSVPRPGRASVVVCDGAAPSDQVRSALLAGALDVIAWPDDRDRLLEAPLRVQAPRVTGPGAPCFLVGGVAGGAGTSTVALAIAGLGAWSGKDVIVVGGDGLLTLCGQGPWRGPGAGDLALLPAEEAAVEVAGLVRPVGGVGRLQVLGGAQPGVTPSVAGWPTQMVVWDAGLTGTAPSLLVGRPDTTLRSASPGPVVVVGDRSMTSAQARRALGRDPVGWLPWSARVAQAGLRGRVPSALPGSWLAALRRILGQVRP